MINIPYLLKILKTNKLSELVENIDAPPIDINLAIWDAEERGHVKIDPKKDRIEALVEPEVSFDSDLASKLLKTIQHYTKQGINPTRGTINGVIKEPMTERGYKWHDYLTSLQYLIDSGQVLEMEGSVPKSGKRPYHKFVFLCLPDNPNDDWNRNELNKWIANWEKNK